MRLTEETERKRERKEHNSLPFQYMKRLFGGIGSGKKKTHKDVEENLRKTNSAERRVEDLE